MRWRRPFRQIILAATVCCSLLLFVRLYYITGHYDLPAALDDLTITTTIPQSIGDQILGDDAIRFVDSVPNTTDAKHAGKPKVIVTWNAGHAQEHLNGCPDWNCVLVSDHSRVGEADAILLSTSDGSLPPRRSHQYYVHFNQESPAHHTPNVPYPNYFNMSLGYRRDAALPSPYGYAIKLNNPLSPAEAQLSDEQLKAKTKPIAWFVSNCAPPSKRQEYVAELSKHIAVDKFGACGEKACPRGRECEVTLSKQYRFYLALENSICKDYITEKFWNQGYLDVVPIVLKRSIVEKYAPPGSFLALDDFKSPKHLAAHLNALMTNDSAYRAYFNWRTDYKIVFLNGQNHDYKERPWGFCRLCQLLWQQPRPQLVINDFNKWWSQDAQCDQGDFVTKLLEKKSDQS
uniref:Fucosyltransferase n=1 Tax=Plectus sambesii TaxID=2011161 RepID=A0A914XHY8_9BILA